MSDWLTLPSYPSHRLPAAERLKYVRYRVAAQAPHLPAGERVIPFVCRSLGTGNMEFLATTL